MNDNRLFGGKLVYKDSVAGIYRIDGVGEHNHDRKNTESKKFQKKNIKIMILLVAFLGLNKTKNSVLRFHEKHVKHYVKAAPTEASTHHEDNPNANNIDNTRTTTKNETTTFNEACVQIIEVPTQPESTPTQNHLDLPAPSTSNRDDSTNHHQQSNPLATPTTPQYMPGKPPAIVTINEAMTDREAHAQTNDLPITQPDLSLILNPLDLLAQTTPYRNGSDHQQQSNPLASQSIRHSAIFTLSILSCPVK